MAHTFPRSPITMSPDTPPSITQQSLGCFLCKTAAPSPTVALLQGEQGEWDNVEGSPFTQGWAREQGQVLHWQGGGHGNVPLEQGEGRQRGCGYSGPLDKGDPVGCPWVMLGGAQCPPPHVMALISSPVPSSAGKPGLVAVTYKPLFVWGYTTTMGQNLTLGMG